MRRPGQPRWTVIARFLKWAKKSALLRRLGIQPHSAPIDDYRRGTVIYQEDEPSDACYLVLGGACESRHKGEAVTLGPGDVFGERDVLGEKDYERTIRVTEDSVLLRMGRNRLRHLLQERPELAGYLNWKSREPHAFSAIPSPGCGAILLASLSPGIPDLRIAEQLCGALRVDTGEPILLVHLTREETDFRSDESLDRHLHRNDAGFSTLNVRVTSELKDAAGIAPLLARLNGGYCHLVIHAGAEVPIETLISCLDQCSKAYVLLRPTPEDLYSLNLLMRELRSLPGIDRSRIKPLVYFPDDKPVHDVCQWIEQSTGAPVHAFLRENAFLSANIRRLARETTGRRLGLALSSGAARGLAHIGVIQVLEENGIEPDVIAGSSMGAYIASIWGCGFDGKVMEKLALEIRSPWEMRHLIDLILTPSRGFVRGERAKRRLKRTIGDAHFSDTVRPIRIVATRLDTLERKIFTHGEVASAVHASIAIPGICMPVTLENTTYVDGGIADPLPVDVLSEMCVTRIIAVNTIPTPENLRDRIAFEREIALAESGVWRAPFTYLNRAINPFAGGNMFDIMMRSLHGVQIRVAETSCLGADIVLRPHSCEGRWHDFANAARYIALGRQAALENLAQIKALAETPIHGPTTAPLKMAVAA